MNNMKKVAKAEVKAHEKRMHGAKKMAKGGVTTDQRMALGRVWLKLQTRNPLGLIMAKYLTKAG
jgi:hypothetical protein